jgi:hypothetical protein
MRRTLKLALPLLAALLAGCPTSSASLPLINSFTATPSSVHLGNKTTLAWDVSGATSISIDNGVGPQTGHSVDVTPSTTTTYTLTATGPGGSVPATVTVTVLPAVAKPVITEFSASPNDVPFNGSTNLSWTVTGANSISVTDGTTTTDLTTKTPPYAWTLGTAASYTFTLTATNDGGSVTSTALVTTHSPVLHLQYTDPTSTTAKILLVRNASSTGNRLVLDVKVGATPITAFGFAMNVPVQASSNGMIALDTNLSPAGLIGGGAINIGSGPATGAVILGGPAMPNILSMGVAKHKATAADGDVAWAANSTLFSIAFTMTASAADGTTVFLGSAAMADPKFRAAAMTKAGTQAATSTDVALGDFVISL